MELVIGIVQADFNGTPLENSEKTFRIVISKHKEAELVILPEYSMLNPLKFNTPEEVYAYSEVIERSTFLDKIKRLAETLSIHIIANIIEKTDKPPLSRNTSVLVKNDGEVVPLYSKIHLFDALGYRESKYFLPGDAPSKFLNIRNFRISVAVCYDLRFPELFRFYALNGADAVFVQAGWVKGLLKEEVLDKLSSVRAHENTMYLVLADQVGDFFVGRSGVFNPLGYRELDMGVSEDYREFTLELDKVKMARERLPVINQSKKRWEVRMKELHENHPSVE
ncbi:MAG: nitrilase-related carbon-nitrogen hydrolase [Thermosphaera sp.]